MLTPQEVAEHAFAKASFGGYNMAMVDEFLDLLTADYTALYKENAALKTKMKVLADKVEEYRSTDDAMRKALLSAQKYADQVMAEADEKKQNGEPRLLLHSLEPLPDLSPRGSLLFRRAAVFLGGQKFEPLLLFQRAAEQEDHIARKDRKQNEAVPPFDGAPPHAKPHEQRARKKQNGKIEPQRAPLNGQFVHERRNAQNEQDIRDVAPDDVADRDVGGSLDRRGDRDRKLGRARAEGDDGEPDHERRDLALFRNFRAALHKPIRPLDKQRKAYDQQKNL